MPGPRVIKLISCSTQSEHEILNACMYENIKNQHFSCSYKSRMLIFLLINVKMPIIVGILTLEQEKFHGHLS